MPEVAFVMSPRQHHPLRELAETVGHELGVQAVPSALHLNGFPEPRADLVYVLLDPRGYIAAGGAEALPDDAILARTIMLCVEPPPADPEDPHLAVLRRAGAVFVIDQRAAIALSRLGVRARLLRPGYTRIHDHFDADAERPVDVLFVGAHTLRRTRYLNHAARILARLNCAVHLAPAEPAPGETSSFLAESRWPLLAQTKVVINLHCGEQTRLEWRRVIDAVHAGAVVVTEHSSGLAPLVAGEHLLVASPDALPFVAESLVRDPHRLAALRSAAYERLSTWVPFALPVAVLRAAIVELVGEPIPPDVSLGRPGATSQPDVSRGRPGATAVPPEAAPALSASGEFPPDTADADAPRVTVVAAIVGATGDEVEATLDSVAHGVMRDLELLVVGGRAIDPGDIAAAAWIHAHGDVAAQLITAGPGASLGTARNAGLAAARAPLCLLLDAGQGLYPRGLRALADALDGDPDAAFAYPIGEVIGQPDDFAEAGGDYLLSFLGWDAARLRRGNYIHAPALVRTGVLRALGGCAADEALRGFEDYDLWCRIADRGGRGVLVAQVLARRSESARSAALAAIHAAPGAQTRALTDRAPGLLAGAFAPSQ